LSSCSSCSCSSSQSWSTEGAPVLPLWGCITRKAHHFSFMCSYAGLFSENDIWSIWLMYYVVRSLGIPQPSPGSPSTSIFS
jgi:hypothetical protein